MGISETVCTSDNVSISKLAERFISQRHKNEFGKDDNDRIERHDKSRRRSGSCYENPGSFQGSSNKKKHETAAGAGSRKGADQRRAGKRVQAGRCRIVPCRNEDPGLVQRSHVEENRERQKRAGGQCQGGKQRRGAGHRPDGSGPEQSRLQNPGLVPGPYESQGGRGQSLNQPQSKIAPPTFKTSYPDVCVCVFEHRNICIL